MKSTGRLFLDKVSVNCFAKKLGKVNVQHSSTVLKWSQWNQSSMPVYFVKIMNWIKRVLTSWCVYVCVCVRTRVFYLEKVDVICRIFITHKKKSEMSNPRQKIILNESSWESSSTVVDCRDIAETGVPVHNLLNSFLIWVEPCNKTETYHRWRMYFIPERVTSWHYTDCLSFRNNKSKRKKLRVITSNDVIILPLQHHTHSYVFNFFSFFLHLHTTRHTLSSVTLPSIASLYKRTKTKTTTE